MLRLLFFHRVSSLCAVNSDCVDFSQPVKTLSVAQHIHVDVCEQSLAEITDSFKIFNLFFGWKEKPRRGWQPLKRENSDPFINQFCFYKSFCKLLGTTSFKIQYRRLHCNSLLYPDLKTLELMCAHKSYSDGVFFIHSSLVSSIGESQLIDCCCGEW